LAGRCERLVIDTRHEFDQLFNDLYLPLMIAVAALVWGAVLFALVRYRARRGHVPSRRSDAKIVESTYAVVLAGIAAFLVWHTFTTEDRVDRVAAGPGLRVDVVAFKWQWRFSYPGRGVTVVGTAARAPELVVPTRTTIQFSLTSRDVIHALWIPELRFKRDAFPHRTTKFDLMFDEPGEFTGRCAEFCGLDHADMTLHVEAVPPAAFRTWIATRRR
jgi:cytochrome c oxidase subunit 2